MTKLRIMSNNIWYCDNNAPKWAERGIDCSTPHRAGGFARTYRETMPDIIGFQECSALMADSIMQVMAQHNLPYALLWGKDTPIVYRTDKFELVDSEYFIYPESVPNYKGCFNNNKTKSYCIAIFRVKENGKLILFATTHLWYAQSCHYPHSDEARAYQINLLLDRVDILREKYNCPAIVVGDLNSVYTSLAVQSALKRGYLHSYDIAAEYRDETRGWHFCDPNGYDMNEDPKDFTQSIDHILIRDAQDGFVRRFERYAPEYYMPLSDHFPVWIDVEM